MMDTYMEQEWKQMRREEQRFLRENRKLQKSGWQERVSEYVPDNL